MTKDNALCKIAGGVLIALPILFALYVMVTRWVAVPWWDEWLTPGATLASFYRGTLTFADLWSQHNESRKLFPRLLYLALYVPNGWDVRYGMILGFAWVCTGAVGLYWLLRTSISSGAACLAFFLMNLLLFSPRQYENFLYGIEGENFTPSFALVFALLCNLRANRFRTKTIVSALLALVSTYTFANGMILWLLAFPIRWKRKPPLESAAERRSCRIGYSIVGVLAIATYFIGYHQPAGTPAFALEPARLPELMHYFAIWTGDVFITPAPAVLGALVTISFVCLSAAAIWHARTRNLWHVFYPWLTLGCYVLISGGVVAAGRVGFGIGVAFDVRYTVFTVFLYIAVIALFCCLIDRTAQPVRLIPIVVAGALIVAWLVTLKQEIPQLAQVKADREQLRLVTRWSLAIPANPDLASLSPYPNTLQTIQVLADHKALRPRLVNPALSKAGGQEQEIIDSNLALPNDKESAVVAALPGNYHAYTAVISRVNHGMGVGLMEVHDLDYTVDSKLQSISTRGLVQTGNDVMIAGTTLLGSTARYILIRALGPSLPFSNSLADPYLELRDSYGTLIRADDDWRTGGQEQDIIYSGNPPPDDAESAIVATLPAGGAAYTAIVSGVNNTTGVASVEIYAH